MTKVADDVHRLYVAHVLRGKQTYHEFCRTVAMSLGWPVQRCYSLIKVYFPGEEYNGENSIYESIHRYGF